MNWKSRAGNRLLALEHTHNVVFTDDEIFFIVDFDFGAGIFAKQHGVNDLDAYRAFLAIVQYLARTDGNDLAADGFFRGGVGNDDAPGAGALLFHAFDNHAILQWTNLHKSYLLKFNALLII